MVSAVATLAMLLTTVGSTPTEAGATPPDPQPGRGDYVVVLNAGVAAEPAAVQAAREHRGRVGVVYEHAIRGFSIQLPPRAAAALAANPNVAYVEVDHRFQAAVQTTPTGLPRSYLDPALVDIDGLDDRRVDADVAILDSGVDLDHPDLSVAGGVTCIDGACVAGGDDDNGHGTHVAGTVGALDNGYGTVGVAPGARIWSVKVLDHEGYASLSGVLAGLDWVVANADTIEVANMSLGGKVNSRAQEQAIQAAVDAGVAFAVAAGNNSDMASKYSPAQYDNVMTVSALADYDGAPGGLATPTCQTDADDTLADFSNYGRAIDIAAPGVCIYSTTPVEFGSYGTASGTSVASPHVAAALALLASQADPVNAADVEALYAEVLARGNFDWTDDSDHVQEPLLDLTGVGAVMVDVSSPPPTPEPTPEPTPTPGPTPTPAPTPTPEPTPTPGPVELSLAVATHKVRGAHVATLTWSGADAVNILRDGPVIAAGVTTSPWVDELGTKGSRQVSYLICTPDMLICSDLVAASW